MSPQEAYQKIEEYFYPDYRDSDDEDVYWLSIALFQWQNGILNDQVKQRALKCMEEESYLDRWRESGEKVYQKRKETLKILKNKLLNEVNPVKKKFPKCPKYYRIKTDWKVGDLLAYRILEMPAKWTDGREDHIAVEEAGRKLWQKYVLLRVVNVSHAPVTFICPELDYRSCASIMLYDWFGDEIPPMSEIDKMSFRPIVLSYWSKKKQIVSGVALEIENMKKEAANCEITVLGNDHKFVEEIPELYRQNDGCPLEEPLRFNLTLAMTFALRDGDMTEWHYNKKGL